MLHSLPQRILMAIARICLPKPRTFAVMELVGCKLRAAVEEVRGELFQQVCEDYGLQSVRGEEAGRLLAQFVDMAPKLECEGPTEVNTGVEQLLSLVLARAPLDLQTSHGETALIRAAEDGKLKMVQVLIEAGASLDIQTHDGETALIRASEEGEAEIVKALIAARAGLDVQDENDETALYRSAISGYEYIARALIAARAALDMRNDENFSPLYTAESRAMETRLVKPGESDAYNEIAMALMDAGAELLPDEQLRLDQHRVNVGSSSWD